MRFSLIFIVFLFIATLFVGCVKREKGCTDLSSLNYNPDAIYDDGSCIYALPTPSVYYFLRFDASSVSYSSISATQFQVSDSYYLCKQLGSNPNFALSYTDTLRQLYANSLSNMLVQTPLNTTLSPPKYSGFGFVASLNSKMNKIYRADSIADTLLSIIKTNALIGQIGTPAVYTTENGIDASELLHKTLLGSVLYYQGTNLLNTLFNNSNTTLVSGTNYTAMEHAWDEAFGYYGASIDLNSYTNTSLTNPNGNYYDSNLNGMIEANGEYNFNFVTQAATLALDNPSQTNYNTLIFEAFLTGRAGITNKNDTIRRQQATIIVEQWEKLLANNALYHANLLSIEVANIGTPNQNTAAINQHWSAMIGYILALQYNSQKIITQTQIAQLKTSAGNFPPNSLDFQEKINEIKQILVQTYHF
ncbi:MAG: DUF4856 domain-containing protein [Chitinophagales bacterium]|nr:DUF4856 domain-containing protein [Chitinophagales bacterium]